MKLNHTCHFVPIFGTDKISISTVFAKIKSVNYATLLYGQYLEHFKNSLNLFTNMIRNKHFTEYEVAERQLVMKRGEEKSWFQDCPGHLQRPSIFSLFKQPLSKAEWKRTLT